MAGSFIDRTDPTFRRSRPARGHQRAVQVRTRGPDCALSADRPAWHPEAHEGLEPARSVPVHEMPAPAAEGVLGGEVAGLTEENQCSAANIQQCLVQGIIRRRRSRWRLFRHHCRVPHRGPDAVHEATTVANWQIDILGWRRDTRQGLRPVYSSGLRTAQGELDIAPICAWRSIAASIGRRRCQLLSGDTMECDAIPWFGAISIWLAILATN